MTRLFIDVREPEEYAKGHVAGAVNIPPLALIDGATALATVPKDSELVVYCVSGSRSNVAKHLLTQLGYTNVANGINKDQVNAKYAL